MELLLSLHTARHTAYFREVMIHNIHNVLLGLC